MQDKFLVEEGAREGLRPGRIGMKCSLPKRARVPCPHACVVSCNVSALFARVKGERDGGPSRGLSARCMRAACEHVMSAHVCVGPRVMRAMLFLLLSALNALSGIVALFYALWPCRARACDATWGDVSCMP